MATNIENKYIPACNSVGTRDGRRSFSVSLGNCISATEFFSFFKGSKNSDTASSGGKESNQLDGDNETDGVVTDPALVSNGSTYVFISRGTGEVIVLQNTGHIATVKALTMLKRTPSLWVELKQISLTDAVQDTASHRLMWNDDKRRKSNTQQHLPPRSPSCTSPPSKSLQSPATFRSPTSSSDGSEGVFTPRSVHTPQPTDNLEGNGVAQWTVNERFASLEVRRAELDEYLAKLQTIVDRNINYCMFSTYKRGLSSKMDKRAQMVLYSWATILKAKALSINLPNVMDLAQESLRGILAIQEMAGEQFKTNVGSVTDSEDWWILLVLGKAKQYVTDLLREAIRRNEAKMVNSHSNVVSSGDFNIIRLINRGGNSMVYLGRKNNSKELYAIKAIRKDTVSDVRMRQRVLHERQILSLLDDKSPYVCRLVYAFRSLNYLFLVQEYIDGCDCNTLLRTSGTLTHETALYLVAEIVLGVGFLHRRQVVHRDLKPDNILVSREGHAKIADFGLSRKKQNPPQPFLDAMNGSLASKGSINVDMTFRPLQEKGMLYSPVGTQLYLAPEVILGMGYDFQIDWWSVGVMLYEFLMGKTPFEGQDVDDLYNNIISGLPDWPEDSPISPDVQNLISRLLEIDPNKRLGASGGEAVKEHCAFDTIQWDKLYTMPSPLVPYLDKLTPQVDNEMDEEAVGAPLDEVIAKVDDERSLSTSGLEAKNGIPMNGTGESCWGNFSYCNASAVSGIPHG